GSQRGDDPWPLFHIHEHPSIHRIRWIDADGNGRKALLVAPLMGIDSEPPDFSQFGVELYLLRVPLQPQTDHWLTETIDRDLRMCHAAMPVQFDNDPPEEFLTGSLEGVHVFKHL